MEELLNLKKLYDAGLMSQEEFDKRRVTLIDQITSTTLTTKTPAPIVAKAAPKTSNGLITGAPGAERYEVNRDWYAQKDFNKTNSDVYAPSQYVIVTPPVAYNSHLYTTKASVYPGGQHVSDTVPIEPERARNKDFAIPSKAITPNQTVVFANENAGSASGGEQVQYLEDIKRKLGWQLFEAAADNDIQKLKDLIDRGADPNQRDHDTEGTPIMVAAAKGRKHAVYYLVERGAHINTQNNRGETALHEAVKFKFNEVALWLVKKGADLHLENFRGFSSYDLALPWLQKELRDEFDQFNKDKKKELAQKLKEEKAGGSPGTEKANAQNGAQTMQRAPVAAEILKIFLKNGSFKRVNAAANTNATQLVASVAEKLGMSQFAAYLEIVEFTPGGEGRLDPSTSVIQHKQKWPALYPGKEDDCKLVVITKRGTPDTILQMYREAMNNNKDK